MYSVIGRILKNSRTIHFILKNNVTGLYDIVERDDIYSLSSKKLLLNAKFRGTRLRGKDGYKLYDLPRYDIFDGCMFVRQHNKQINTKKRADE